MELDVSFLLDEDCSLLSGSVAELGENAGTITWNNCLSLARKHPIIGEELAEEFRDYIADYGAWEKDEIDSRTLLELSAFAIQEAASDYRSFEDYCGSDWETYQEESEAGSIRGALWLDKSGKLFCEFFR